MENMGITSFFQSKTVLITGHTGFKGSWLSLWLKQLGANVIGFALPTPTQPNLFSLLKLENDMTSIYGDLRNYSEILNVIKQYQPEIVLHLAAQPLVIYSYEQPLETYTTNVLGTLHLFEALRHVNCAKTMVNITTDKCYENKELNRGYHEQDTLGGSDPYSNSKACSELITTAYRHSYFKTANIGLASARAGNVIGGGDWGQHRLLPDIISGCMKNQTVQIRNPHAIRPWQHVLEPLHGYLLLTQHLAKHPEQFADAWNFGPHAADSKSVKWICDYVIKKWGNNNSWVNIDTTKLAETHFLRLDYSKAQKHLGWNPRWDLTTSLDHTIAWYQAYQAKKDMREMTLMQIKQFTSSESRLR